MEAEELGGDVTVHAGSWLEVEKMISTRAGRSQFRPGREQATSPRDVRG
jgi:hypothetical protein